MLVGVIADDFTGASDIAAVLARGGMRTELMIGVSEKGGSNAEAVVVALKSRSTAAEAAVAMALAALEHLCSQGARQIIFKYCSTFDSTPAGNIGPVAEALAARLGVRGVVACPALPENGRTVYHGHLFVRGRLLNESGLESHPLNPMIDPDIRRWLARQCSGPVGLADETVVSRGAHVLRATLEAASETIVIVDAISNANLITIGEATIDVPLITGSSGVAIGLPANYRARGLLAHKPPSFSPSHGPGVVLSGSCSAATLQQVDVHRQAHPSLGIDIDRLMSGDDVMEQATAFARRWSLESPLIYSSAGPKVVARAQERYGTEALAQRIESLFAQLARTLIADGFERIVVAGGEVSGAVVSNLDLSRFLIGREIAPGVPVLAVPESRLRVALKSGNFGQPDFFSRALKVLAGATHES